MHSILLMTFPPRKMIRQSAFEHGRVLDLDVDLILLVFLQDQG